MALTQSRFDIHRIVKNATPSKLALTVLAGGPSGERDVSLDSGRNVAAALESLGHKVQLADIGPDNLAALARQVDCVFIALHGPFGEDGQVQEILERRKLAYCGSGPDACRLAMNKAEAKRRFIQAGLPTPRFDVAGDHNLREALAAWTMPVVVKPVAEGSSLHCYIVRDVAQFRPAVEKVVALYGQALLEDYIPGREITVSILGDHALPAIEIRTRRDFYDYTAKYVDEDTQYVFDIDLPADLLDRVLDMSLAAHRALGCRDFSRVDWRVDDSCLTPYLLEVNVIPGLTGHSLLPKAAARAGLPMPELCQFLVDRAMKRR
jgi:D-alanine-D-alanine ligase